MQMSTDVSMFSFANIFRYFIFVCLKVCTSLHLKQQNIPTASNHDLYQFILFYFDRTIKSLTAYKVSCLQCELCVRVFLLFYLFIIYLFCIYFLFFYFSSQIYETNFGKILMPESKSPCHIGLLKPPVTSGMVIKVTNFS